jgi:excisionase family DNA binding protein
LRASRLDAIQGEEGESTTTLRGGEQMERFSVAEAGRRMGISRHTVRSLIRRRELAAYKIGRRVVVDEQDVARFLAARRVPARGE